MDPGYNFLSEGINIKQMLSRGNKFHLNCNSRDDFLTKTHFFFLSVALILSSVIDPAHCPAVCLARLVFPVLFPHKVKHKFIVTFSSSGLHKPTMSWFSRRKVNIWDFVAIPSKKVVATEGIWHFSP